MEYDLEQEVKEVEATVLFTAKVKLTLIGADYQESDGTDSGAVMTALFDVGIPEHIDLTPHSVVSVTEVLYTR